MFVVALPPSAASNPLAFARKAKNAGADILEIRGDLTPDAQSFASPIPLLVSPRGEGIAFIKRFSASFVDLEQSECSLLDSLDSRVKAIISFHDHKKTADLSVLKKIVQKMCSNKPWMIKIATTINSYGDLMILQKLQEHLNKKSIRFSVLGMGKKAHMLRVLSPVRNAFTYSYLDGTEPAAPGQLPLSFYRLLPRARRPALFGIIGGEQVTDSLSPLIHNALFRRHKINAVYSCFPTDDFPGTFKVLQKFGVQGFSVTAPFKRDAAIVSKKHDAFTEKLGVANTLRSSLGSSSHSLPLMREKESGKVSFLAFNTDVFGFEKGYPELQHAKTIAIIGAGGAVPAVILAIRRMNPKTAIIVFARDPKKARSSLSFDAVAFKSLRDASMFVADAVICAITEDASFPIPNPKVQSPKSFHPIAIDLRYGKTTAFMRDAAKQGYRVHDGIPMLLFQALRQFEIFTGKETSRNDVTCLQSLLKAPNLL